MLKFLSIFYVGTACLLMPLTIWKFDWPLGIILAFGAAIVVMPILVLLLMGRGKWH